MADEETYGAQARDWLESVDVPPTRLDVAQIVQIGRSQVRRRRLLAAGGTAAALAAVAVIPAAVPVLPPLGGLGSSRPLSVLDCEVVELPLPDEFAEREDAPPDATAAAIDPTGRFVVGDGPYRAEVYAEGNETIAAYEPNWLVLWEDGNPRAISPLRGGATATGVNADGVVVGYGADAPDSYYAWIYRDGEMSELPTPDGYLAADPEAINAAGDVVGTLRDADYQPSVVVWPADDLDNPQVLANPAGVGVAGKEITDDGTVVGDVFTETGHRGAYVWGPDGTGRQLPGPEEAVDVTLWAARGTWAAGNALMSVPTSDDDYELTVLWDLSTGSFRVVDPGTVATVSDVDAAGNVLYAEALVLRDGEPYALPHPLRRGVITPPHRFSTSYVAADAISDDGSTIVGSVAIGDVPSEVVHPVMWRC